MNKRVGESESSMAFAAACLRQCCNLDAGSTHSKCHISRSEPSDPPTRLLEICGSYSGPNVRLIETEDLPTRLSLRYTALSHCWGPEGSPRLKTTPENIHSRKSEIPWSTIPQTFKDAILFTYQLGVQYIWINSCCIIQDEPGGADWQREAAKMAGVYSHSYFTIVAARSPNSGTGLFQIVSHDLTSRPLMKVSSLDAKQTDQVVLFAQQRQEYDHSCDTREYPLMSRGWCFQERLLSRRLFYFLKGQIVWRCCSTELWEFHATKQDSTWAEELLIFDRTPPPGPIVDYQLEEGSPVSTEFSSMTTPCTPGSCTPIEVIREWMVIVRRYTYLSLTYQDDKLPAIGGMATEISKFRDGKYIAGIWDDAPLHELCWHVQTGTGPKTRVAPSWSWATVSGYIDFGSRQIRRDFFATVEELTCQYSNPERPFTSTVTSGTLKLKSRILPFPKIDWDDRSNKHRSRILIRSKNRDDTGWDFFMDDGTPPTETATLYLLLISRTSEKHHMVDHLIIHQIDEDLDVYERVGFAIYNLCDAEWCEYADADLYTFEGRQRLGYPELGPPKLVTIV